MMRSCRITRSGRAGLLLAISDLLDLFDRGDLSRRTTISSSTPDPPMFPLNAENNQMRSMKAATEPSTMPITVPGAGPELRPAYVAGIAI